MIARMKRLLLVALLLAAVPAAALGDYDDGRDAYRTGDFEGALREWLPLVRSGDPPARHSLGILFLYGRAVERDAEAAAALFAQAAEEGLSEAQYALATLFRDGTGVTRNVAEAVRLYRLAAAQAPCRSPEQPRNSVCQRGGRGARRRCGADVVPAPPRPAATRAPPSTAGAWPA